MGISYPDWQAKQNQATVFVSGSQQLELRHQIARLLLLSDMTHAELADIVGTRLSWIACPEKRGSMPSLFFLERIAGTLDARLRSKYPPGHHTRN